MYLYLKAWQIILYLTQQEECVALLQDTEEGMPIGSVVDLRPMMERTTAEGTFVDQSDLVDIRLNVSTLHSIVNYIRRQDEEKYPSLINIVADAQMFPQVENAINSIIDKYGNVRTMRRQH